MKELKKTIIRCAAESKEGHIPSALSILDILWVLYDKVLNIKPGRLDDPHRDHFILSKGHGSLGLYVTLAEKGFFPKKELKTFGSFHSRLGGHPDRNKVPGAEASTGSLGHGFPMSLGLALGLRIKKSKGRVFVLIGDGEANEGTIWETAMIAAHHHLNNLICIVDHNHSTDRALLVDDLTKKFQSFGWDAVELPGHDQKKLEKVLNENRVKLDRPLVIVAQTVKGYGIKSIENSPAWHHRSPTMEEMEAMIKEI